jgi:hypothetical protein
MFFNNLHIYPSQKIHVFVPEFGYSYFSRIEKIEYPYVFVKINSLDPNIQSNWKVKKIDINSIYMDKNGNICAKQTLTEKEFKEISNQIASLIID